MKRSMCNRSIGNDCPVAWYRASWSRPSDNRWPWSRCVLRIGGRNDCIHRQKGNPELCSGPRAVFIFTYVRYLMAATVDSGAFQKVSDFERTSDPDTSWLNPKWAYIKKQDVVDGLKDRLASPDHIDTSNLNLCGPGLFFYFLAQDEPATYAQIVIDLFRQRKAWLGSRKITAPNELVISPVTKGVDPVDWIPMTSLRSDENFVLVANDDPVGLDALTMPSAITKWLDQAGYTDTQNETNVWRTKGVDSIREASDYLGRGYRVGLFINSNMLHSTQQSSFSFFPNHWVSLETPFRLDPRGNAVMSVWSWTRTYLLPVFHTLSPDELLKNYYGYIAGKPPGPS